MGGGYRRALVALGFDRGVGALGRILSGAPGPLGALGFCGGSVLCGGSSCCVRGAVVKTSDLGAVGGGFEPRRRPRRNPRGGLKKWPTSERGRDAANKRAQQQAKER